MALSDLKFSDLFLPARIEDAWYKETHSALDRIPVPFALADDMRRLRSEMATVSGSLDDYDRPDFRIDFDVIRATIRAGDFHLLKSEIKRQSRLFISRGLP